MARRMADPHFRSQQRAKAYDDHVRPINEFVDALRTTGNGWVPHVAPHHGGVEAQVLVVLRSPGPGTAHGTGSGFLSTENDDATAETMSGLLARADINTRSVVPWNAYPWSIDGVPSTAQLAAGVEPLVRLTSLLTDVRVVLLHGGEAQRSWKRAAEQHPVLCRRWPEGFVISTYSPSRQALFHPDPQVRSERSAHRKAAYAEVARLLVGPAVTD
jgi:hypothetical protein